MIHVINGIDDKILSVIDEGEYWDDVHHKSLKDTKETFDFSTFGDRAFSAHLGKRNRIVIPDEDGTYVEFVIGDVRKYRQGPGILHAKVRANASYLDLAKAKVIQPGKLEAQSLSTLVTHAIGQTEWQAGNLASTATRTIDIENYTDAYSFLKHLATEFNLELRFRVEVRGNRITGRYVDLVPRNGAWRGAEIEFGVNMAGIERIENTEDIVTALVGVGPEKEDGTRLQTVVEDLDAQQRWGRIDPVTRMRRHIIEHYEPQSNEQDMELSRLEELTRNELEKRINEVVTYTADVAVLEGIGGNRKVYFGDTIRVKDTSFHPPLYLDARVHTMERSISDPSRKTIVLGDYVERTEQDILALWRSMQKEIQDKIGKQLTVNIQSSGGLVFLNGTGNSTLRATLFLANEEVDTDGSTYTYSWTKYKKDGTRDMGFARAGKSITVTIADVDEKATFHVEIAFQGKVIQFGLITISELYDGQPGPQGPEGPQGIEGPRGPSGQTLYTWVKYADTATGGGMSDSPSGKTYIGLAYNKTTATESSNASDYSWSLIKGDQGVQGPTGPSGQPTYTWIKYATTPTSGMSDDPTGKAYMGIAYNKLTQTESTNYSDYSWSKVEGPQGPQGEQGVQGPAGPNGQTLYTWVKYADTATGGGMSDSPTGKTYIGLAYNKTTATESSTASDYTWSLIKGDQGAQGPPGSNGAPTYTWLKYADTPSTGMSDSPTGKKYMGIAYNKTTPTESTNYSDYQWSLIQGPQGPTGQTGSPGPQGLPGPNIVNSSTVIEANVIKSNHIQVSNLSALSANLGNVTAGNIRGAYIYGTDIEGSVIRTSDTSDFFAPNYTNRAELRSGYFKFESVNPSNNGYVTNKFYGWGMVLEGNGEFAGLSAPTNYNNKNTQITYNTFGVNTVAGTARGVFYINANRFGVGGMLGPAFEVNGDNATLEGAMTLGTDLKVGFNRSISSDTGYLVVRAGDGHLFLQSDNEVRITKKGSQSVSGSTLVGHVIRSGNMMFNGYNSLIHDNNDAGFFIQAYATLNLRGDNDNILGHTADMQLGSDSTGARIWSTCIYERTYSAAANVHITSSYTLGRSTSASKYKLAIENANDDYEKILDLQPKKWFDRTTCEQYSDYLTKQAEGEEIDIEEEDIPFVERHYGLIAEDLVKAGLEQFVLYGADGEEIEGIEYDRLWTYLIPLVKDDRREIAELKAELAEIKASLQNQ